MQLVVMTTVLALAGASKLCSSGCSLQVYTIPVESCNKTEYVDTTLCAGQCYHEDPVYFSATRQTEQNVCNGNWTYKVKHIRGCSVGVSYPVATSCKCTSCNEDYTDCAARINHSCF
ncbi:follitropin subunit beta [Hippocampus comes]|uniref:Gonadotropin subunit beta-1-like n=1 Tax=Hippocampus comes TaxID=109280 RepID=A0A3Q2YD31_HIPCM|nr:PREDICTED: gonadotropin subunit beta-1-like [Hippocampus comes]